jgi:hypothetical protein
MCQKANSNHQSNSNHFCKRGPGSARGARSAAWRRRIASKGRDAVGVAPRNPRRRPRRGGKPRLKDGFLRDGADQNVKRAMNASRGAPGRSAGTTMCTGPRCFRCTNPLRDPPPVGGAPAMGLRGPHAIFLRFQSRFFFSLEILSRFLQLEIRSFRCESMTKIASFDGKSLPFLRLSVLFLYKSGSKKILGLSKNSIFDV